MVNETKLRTQFVQLLKCWLCDMQLAQLWRRIGPFVEQCQLAGIAVFSVSHQFAEHTFQM